MSILCFYLCCDIGAGYHRCGIVPGLMVCSAQQQAKSDIRIMGYTWDGRRVIHRYLIDLIQHYPCVAVRVPALPLGEGSPISSIHLWARRLQPVLARRHCAKYEHASSWPRV